MASGTAIGVPSRENDDWCLTPSGHTDVEMHSSATLVGWYSQNLLAGRYGPYV